MARSPPGGGAAAAWARGPPEAWFLSFGRWEDKRAAMAYAKDFHDPRVLGDLLLPWPGEGDTLEVRDLGASQVWAGVQFASERLGGGDRRREGAVLDSDESGARAGAPRASGAGSRQRRGLVGEKACGISEPVSGGSSCSDEESPPEPPLSSPRRPRRRAPAAKAGQPRVRPSPKTNARGQGGGRRPRRDEKLVTSEATTTPDGGDSSAEGGPGGGGGIAEPPAIGPRGAPAGNEAICVSYASDRETGEILRRGLGEMGACPIPRDLWDELVAASLPERVRGVQLPEGKGYPSPETEVMLEVLKDQGVFDEVHVGQGDRGGPNCTPFVIPKNDIKASMIMDCTPGNAADPEPPPHFILASWTALGEWLQVYGGGGGVTYV